MPLSEEDIYRKEIDDAVADVKQQIQSSKAHGTSPRLPDYEDLFGKIVKSATRDPRMSPRTVENVQDHAKKRYKELAIHAGLKGDVLMEAHVLRGLQVHIAILQHESDVRVLAFSDERQAINAVDSHFEKHKVKTTVAQVREYEDDEPASMICSEHPLYETLVYGSRVETCTIN